MSALPERRTALCRALPAEGNAPARGAAAVRAKHPGRRRQGAVGVNALAGRVAHLILLVIFFTVAGHRLAQAFTLPSASKLLLFLAVAAAVTGIVLATRVAASVQAFGGGAGIRSAPSTSAPPLSPPPPLPLAAWAPSRPRRSPGRTGIGLPAGPRSRRSLPTGRRPTGCPSCPDGPPGACASGAATYEWPGQAIRRVYLTGTRLRAKPMTCARCSPRPLTR
jgi:hypothetical protein